MNCNVKNTLILLFMACFLTNHAYAFDLDETVDDEIRKNYKTEEEKLPALPAITNFQNTNTPSQTTQITKPTKPSTTITGTQKTLTNYTGTTKVRGGTSFDVVSTQAISDWQQTGTSLSFKTKNPVYGKNYTIPAGTVFRGEIVSSHQPQITCNGGLVAIKVYSMQHNGHTIPINAYITRANDKKIFLNKIKGERNYIKTTWKKGNWGRTLFNRMMTLTVNLGSEGATLVLSPFPLAYGTICLGVNTITSPICAFFSKGKHISIPAGKPFRIKLVDDALI